MAEATGASSEVEAKRALEASADEPSAKRARTAGSESTSTAHEADVPAAAEGDRKRQFDLEFPQEDEEKRVDAMQAERGMDEGEEEDMFGQIEDGTGNYGHTAGE